MSNLVLNPKWNTSINQVENGELISGGPDGNANLATKQLAENVWFLKDSVENSLSTKANKADVYTKTEADGRYSQKSTTLNGYGITDAYTKTQIDSKTGDLTTLKTTDKTQLVKSINEVFDSTKGVVDLYGKNVEAGPGANGWDANLVTYGETTQKQINDGLESIATMLAIKNPRNGQRVTVKSYHTGQNKGGGTFVYDNSKANTNDKGMVINGWVRQDVKTVTVWDFGYKTDDAVASKNALIAALTSSYPLQLLDETLNAHTLNNQGVLWQTVTTNKVIFGKSKQTSIINGLRLQFEGDDLIVKDCAINENGLNYAIFAGRYQNLLVENFSSKGNLDAVLIMHAKSNTAKALVTNCHSENSSRIGFTADIDATNVVFEKCYSYNCRQGFHAEGVSKVTFIDCTANKCGDSAMPRIPDYQPWEYASGFRLHVYNDVKLIRCKNINKNGGNTDQIGGGGTDLYMEDCEGINFLTDYDTSIYKNITLKQLKNCGFALQSFKAIIAGRVIVHDFDGWSLELNSFTADTTNVVDYAEFKNIKATRLQVGTQSTTATVVLDNVYVRSPYFNAIGGFAHYILGDLIYSWDNSNDEHYPNLGYRFISKNMKSFTLNSFRTIGARTGYHLSIEAVNAADVKTAMINTLVDEGNSSYALYNPNNVDVKILSRKGAAVANATATDDTANKLNALLTSLRNAKVIAP